MNEELKKLFEAKHRAYQQYQVMLQVNTFGKSDEEPIDIDIALETAKQVWFATNIKYNAALEKHVKDQNNEL